MEIRRLGRDEVELLWAIDRSEVSDAAYVVDGGSLALVPRPAELAGWPQAVVEAETPVLYECFDRGGIFLGAFGGEQVMGVAVLEGGRVGRDSNQLPLAYLYVSREHRGHGIGSRLFDAAVALAREGDASALYVSATPTQATVDFYLRRGCVLAPDPDPGLLAAEPDDIHLVLPL
ncbi:MAG: hypothetical protein QOH73_55 [Gaiellaceae bacterium]|nr:hypothetical protein [Gaiellaceae bacterium]